MNYEEDDEDEEEGEDEEAEEDDEDGEDEEENEDEEDGDNNGVGFQKVFRVAIAQVQKGRNLSRKKMAEI